MGRYPPPFDDSDPNVAGAVQAERRLWEFYDIAPTEHRCDSCR